MSLSFDSDNLLKKMLINNSFLSSFRKLYFAFLLLEKNILHTSVVLLWTEQYKHINP